MVNRATVAAAFFLSTAASDRPSPNQRKLTPEEQKELFEEVNIRRCTKGYARVQWSDALQSEAQELANETPHWPKVVPHPHVHGFDTVKRLVDGWYQFQPHVDDSEFPGVGDPRKSIQWWDEHEDHPELYEASFFGCGKFTWSHLETYHHDFYQVVCNFAYSGNKEEWVHKEVLPRKEQTRDECKREFDSINHLEDELERSHTRRVTIAYTPPQTGLAASQRVGGCDVKEYRLLFNGRLALVGFDQDNKMCEGADDFTEHDNQGWEWSYGGLFTQPTDEKVKKSCLNLRFSDDDDAPPHLQTVNRGTSYCTSTNVILCDKEQKDKDDCKSGSGWQFTQTGFADNICMQQVPTASINGKLVVYQEHLLAANPDDPNGCSSSWQMRQFEGRETADQAASLQSDLPQQNAIQNNNHCKVCRNKIGNFACANTMKHGCVLAATSFDCFAMGGEWCQPTGWIEHGGCGPQCDGAVDPLQQPGQAGCVQLGGVYKTDAADCARIADQDFQKSECRQQNQYNDQDIADCENLVEQSLKMTANVFDTVAGYVYDKPPHEPYCRLWQCSGLSSENIPHQDGDQAWLIAYKLKKIESSSILV